jgi:tetratricopeptide (TPR) repeat protein
MKKTLFTLISALLMTAGLNAQSVAEGVKHLMANRFKSASSVFEKLLAVNPNDAEAAYWLGQTYLESEEIMGARLAAARQLYEKTLASTNHPLVLVGRGHIDLLENKPDAARQAFESAITSTKGRKGNDPQILFAVGRAITDSKTGDFHYAVKLLKEVTDIDSKNAMYWVQLGDAYRKAGQGSGGGDAFKSYKKALEVNGSFARASYRLAKLFESQRNGEFFNSYLQEAVQKDPGFTAAYFELFYYHFFRQQYAEAEAQLQKYIESKGIKDIGDEYLYAQLCWARKDWNCAITKATSVVTTLGDATKPKVYRLLADAAFESGDFVNAKKYSDLFFLKKNPDDLGLYDFELRAKILDKTGGTDEEILTTYMQAVTVDTPVTLKVDLMKKGVAYFKDNKKRDREAMLMEKIIEIKPKPSSINDMFDLGVAYYFSENYGKGRDVFLKITEQFPDQVYGYEWAFNSSLAVDTVKKDSIAVPDALKLLGFAEKDTAKFRKQYISSVRFLAAYYINEAKDKNKSLEYFRKWKDIDVANAEKIQEYIKQIENMPATTPRGRPAPKPDTKTSSAAKKPAGKS